MDKKMEAIGFRVSGNDGCIWRFGVLDLGVFKVRGLGLESKEFWQPFGQIRVTMRVLTTELGNLAVQTSGWQDAHDLRANPI